LRETDSLGDVKVEDIMSKDVKTVSSNMTVSELLTFMANKTHIGYPVIDENNELVGVVTIDEIALVDKDSRWKTKVGSIARQNIDVAYPGETALDIIIKMRKQETGRIIVLDLNDPHKILGIVTKRDIMHLLIKQAYENELFASSS
jgi:predicted transcriptional regulator